MNLEIAPACSLGVPKYLRNIDPVKKSLTFNNVLIKGRIINNMLKKVELLTIC